jgi:hypothetical protein
MGNSSQHDMGGMDLIVRDLRVGATAPGETGVQITSGTLTMGTAEASAIVTTNASVQITGLNSIGGSVTTQRAAFVPMLVQQALSGAGAVNLTTFYTAWTTTGADAGTLADATQVGQLKKVKQIVDGGDGTLTFNTNATIVFADAGDYAVLLWNGSDWIPIELGNDADGATAPAYTPAS